MSMPDALRREDRAGPRDARPPPRRSRASPASRREPAATGCDCSMNRPAVVDAAPERKRGWPDVRARPMRPHPHPDPPTCCWPAPRSSPRATTTAARSPAGGSPITDGLVSGGRRRRRADPRPRARVRADGCLVTPGLVNTHHHIYQNLTRAYRAGRRRRTCSGGSRRSTRAGPASTRKRPTSRRGSAWPSSRWADAPHRWTTSTSTRAGGGDLITAEIRAAQELGVRFHATRGSMSRSEKDGGLPPDSVVQDDDTILAESERLVGAAPRARRRAPWSRWRSRPCSPFSVTPGLMKATAELAERLDVRLHTHLAEDADEDTYCLERLRLSPRRVLRGRRLGHRPLVGRALRLPQRGRDRRGSAALGHRRGPLPELEPDDRRRPRPGRRVPGRRRARRASGATARPRPTRPRSGWRAATPCCSAACAAGPRPCRPATRSTWRPAAAPAASAATARSVSSRSGAVGDLRVLAPRRHPLRRRALRPDRGLAALRPTSPRHTVVAGRFVVEDGALVSPARRGRARPPPCRRHPPPGPDRFVRAQPVMASRRSPTKSVAVEATWLRGAVSFAMRCSPARIGS